jgi:Fe-S-cluster containining protein
MFHCDKCGLCCKAIGGNPLFAELDRGDGVCKYLNENLCTIYDNRPLLCRVDDTYNLFFKDYMTLEEFYNENYNICRTLKLNN